MSDNDPFAALEEAAKRSKAEEVAASQLQKAMASDQVIFTTG